MKCGFGFGVSFPTLEWLTTGRFYGVPHSFIAMLAIAAIMWIVLHRSVSGRAIGRFREQRPHRLGAQDITLSR